MTEQEQTKTGFIPEKGVFWIGANIGASIVIITLIVDSIGLIIFRGFIVGTILGLILTLVGVWLGSIFGIKYVVKRSRINPDKIKNISLVAFIIPAAYFLIQAILGPYVEIAMGKEERFIFPTGPLIILIVVLIIFSFFIRHSLRKFTGGTSLPPH